MTTGVPEAFVLPAAFPVPNSRLPVVLYRAAELGGTKAIEERFAANGWGNSWRNGIYPFHHAHTTAHEVLGCANGRALVRLGGDTGRDVTLSVGDVVVIPAGVGHRRLDASPDLVIVGAYPDGRSCDLIRTDNLGPNDFAAAVAQVDAVPLPRTDPLFGTGGALIGLWTAAIRPPSPAPG